MSRRTAALLAAVLLVAGGAYLAGDLADLVPGVLTVAPARPPLSGPLPTPSPTTSPPVAAPPTRTGLATTLASALADSHLGPSVGYSIRDGLVGDELLAQGADTPRRVASLQKILSAFAIAEVLDLDGTLPTKALATTSPGDIVLVAGGDMYLSPTGGDPRAVLGRAGLADLAAQVSSARAGHGGPVRVHLDTSYAAGPAVLPTWQPADIAYGFTGKVTMLGLATQRAEPGRPPAADPPAEAAKAFVAQLRKKGIDAVLAPAGAAPSTTDTLGSIESAPVRDLLEFGLLDSDNALVENLARQAMVTAGADPAGSTGAWVASVLAASGIDRSALRMTDASGLSPGQEVTVAAVSEVLRFAVDGRHEELRAVLLELPVAGLTGTLQDRFAAKDTRRWAGVPRAKTGTLTGVSALAGWTTDASGYPLLYVVVADAVPPSVGGTQGTRDALDRVVGALTSCGCR